MHPDAAPEWLGTAYMTIWLKGFVKAFQRTCTERRFCILKKHLTNRIFCVRIGKSINKKCL